MKKRNLLDKLKKYAVSKQVWILCFIFFIISLVCIVIFSIKVNDMSTVPINELENADRVTRTVFLVLIDVLTVVCSITGTNLLTSLLIQINIQNQAYKDFVVDDFFSDETFLKSLSKEQREDIQHKIERIDCPDDDPLYFDYVNSFCKKLYEEKSETFLEHLEINISCIVSENIITKEITQIHKIRSFKNEACVKNYQLLKSSTQKIDGKKVIDLKKVSIDGQSLDVNKDIYNDDDYNDDPLGELKGYNRTYRFRLKQSLRVKHDNPTTIMFSYKTQTYKDDMNYSYRLKMPCKSFDFNFKICDENDPKKTFKIVSRIYGIQYDIHKPGSGYGREGNEVKYHLDTWGAKRDGVSLSFSENDVSNLSKCDGRDDCEQ